MPRLPGASARRARSLPHPAARAFRSVFLLWLKAKAHHLEVNFLLVAVPSPETAFRLLLAAFRLLLAAFRLPHPAFHFLHTAVRFLLAAVPDLHSEAPCRTGAAGGRQGTVAGR